MGIRCSVSVLSHKCVYCVTPAARIFRSAGNVFPDPLDLFDILDIVNIVRILSCLAPGKAMGAARATHRPVWWFPHHDIVEFT